MSFYNKSHYQFSHHAIQRIKERLNIPKNSELAVKNFVIKQIENSSYQFIEDNFLYIDISSGNKYRNFFIVIDQEKNLIITVTQMSGSKMLSLMT